jgi:hypothetical protein
MAKATKATKATKTATKATAKTRIMDTMKIVVLKKGENPFTSPVQQKHAAACLASHGKLVSEAKRRGCDGWTLRQLCARKIIVCKPEA